MTEHRQDPWGSNPKVRGFCLMGCGQTLFLGDGGYVTCSLDSCPDPAATNDALNQQWGSLTQIIRKLTA